ncbi:hypothetical protein ACFV98_08500 [Streptomyces violascens]|uniref:hypothetical protein n=1 Tax=Streptomyces violascens TaxID=67381 RepID=UPI003650FFDB
MTRRHHQDPGPSEGSDPCELRAGNDPDTALDEVLKEFEEAELREAGGPERDDAHDGEAGDALTPNEEAQEEAAEG